MGKLIEFGIVLVMPANGIGQSVDLRPLAGEEMPTGFGPGAIEVMDIGALLGRRQRRLFARIDADASPLQNPCPE